MTNRVVVVCSHGFMEKGFPDREAAERWIDNFATARRHDPRLCDGDHTVKESDDELPQKQSGSRVRGEGS